MGKFIFDQLNYTNQVILNTVKDLSEEEAQVIPEGFNNNILWNLGHLYVSQEYFAFGIANEPTKAPESFALFFGRNTKPATWTDQPPTLLEVVNLLEEQPNRIREQLENRLDEIIANPFSIPGLTLKTFDELLAFTLFHQGGHLQALKSLIKAIKK
jgi:hypothetical protein